MSKGWTKGVGRIGEVGTEGAVVAGRVVVGVAEREPDAEFVLAVKEELELERVFVLPSPPKESTGVSALSTDVVSSGHRRFKPPFKCPHPWPCRSWFCPWSSSVPVPVGWNPDAGASVPGRCDTFIATIPG